MATVVGESKTTALSEKLFVPYFISTNGEIKRPEHLIAYWARIFSFYVPDEKDYVELRFHCRLFRDALKPPPVYTTFPHPNYPTLNGFMDKLNRVNYVDPTKAPKIVFVKEGAFHGTHGTHCNDVDVQIRFPLKMIGAGQNKTFLTGYRLYIGGKKEGGEVVVQDMTLSAAGNGMHAFNGLSFLCKRITFTKCGQDGVYAWISKGRLINCVVTQCGWSGIFSGHTALIELEGSQTKVDGNNTSGRGYGLKTFKTESKIHLLFPLTKESVSTNNHNGQNYGNDSGGTISTVDSFD